MTKNHYLRQVSWTLVQNNILRVQCNSSTGFTLKKLILCYQYNGKSFMMNLLWERS